MQEQYDKEYRASMLCELFVTYMWPWTMIEKHRHRETRLRVAVIHCDTAFEVVVVARHEAHGSKKIWGAVCEMLYSKTLILLLVNN